MEVFSFKFNYFYCQMYFLGDFLILVVLLWFSLDVQVIYPFFFISIPNFMSLVFTACLNSRSIV